ncbi:LysR family transcriptional regulator [Ramlibacter sp. 2FC]|uniref:LysR family transcriptional regulator n=1 Tax=Ramlibacter sp. 2FC TaxID=2502188 RepID=UPI0010F58445|nr:LysR family transcriptional regulator [Ramlibacter sp. 2FC]
MEADISGLAKVLHARLAAHGRLRQLQLLVALEDCGSIARAAEQIPMSQSAATQALAELERVVGMTLFERHARGVRATPAGRALMSAARGAMAGLLDAAESLAALRQGATATLRLGAIPAAACALISPLLGAFYGAHPEVHLELLEDSGARLLPMLTAGSLDAVFCRAPQRLPAGFGFEPLLADEGVVVAAAGHALAGRSALPMAALAGARWVLPTASIQLREVFETVVLAALPQASWFPVSTLSLPVLEGLLHQPGAVTLLPRSMCANLLAGGRVCRLDVAFSAPLAPLGVAYPQAGGSALLQDLLALARRPDAAARAAA